VNEQDFRVVKESIRPDERGRITLGQALKAKNYRLMVNDAGQILLDPVTTISERELWLWQNSAALASVQRGIKQSGAGRGRDLGDFSQYANLEIED